MSFKAADGGMSYVTGSKGSRTDFSGIFRGSSSGSAAAVVAGASKRQRCVRGGYRNGGAAWDVDEGYGGQPLVFQVEGVASGEGRRRRHRRQAVENGLSCDRSVEAIDYFEAAARSGVDFDSYDDSLSFCDRFDCDRFLADVGVVGPHQGHRGGGFVVGGGLHAPYLDCGSGDSFKAAAAAAQKNKRHRHFSLEDYSDVLEEMSSSNSSGSFATAAAAGKDAAAVAAASFGAAPFRKGAQPDVGGPGPRTREDPKMLLGVAGGGGVFCPEGEEPFGVSGGGGLLRMMLKKVGGNTGPDCGRGFGSGVALDVGNNQISAQLQLELESKLFASVNQGFCRLVQHHYHLQQHPADELAASKLQLPNDLLRVIAGHVIQESSLEPCGLKGCLLYIYFEGENDCQYVNTLRCDPDTIPTFELTLTLRQGQQKRPSSSGWISSIVRRNLNNNVGPNLTVSTSYKLVKRRKYRQHEVEELSLEADDTQMSNCNSNSGFGI